MMQAQREASQRHRPAASASPPSPGHFTREMLRLCGPYWSSGQKWKIRAFTLALFLLTLAQVGLAVWTSYWNRALFDALEQRSVTGFLLQIGVFALIFLLTIGVTGAHLLVKRWLQLGWREWLTARVVDRWMARGRHYALSQTPGEHDNPDGRIAEDIRIVTETAIALAHTLVYSLLILGSFIDILWSVSGTISVPGTSVSVPGYMVPLAFLYAAAGTVLGWMLGRSLVRSTNQLQTAEANFRFGLARSREHSEFIALMHGETIERRDSGRLFADIQLRWNRQSLAYMGIVGFSTGYGALLPVFPILVAAPQFIAGAMSLGMLMQAAQAFQKLTSALSWPVDNLGDMARCRASADRILSLYRDMEALDDRSTTTDTHRIKLGSSGRPQLLIRELCIADPAGQILLERFSARIRRGERVLLSGDPAVTSALFKVIAGLWPWGRGEVLLPDEPGIMFMPQRPYLPVGTLRALLCYPHAADSFSDASIHYALECAGIAWLAPRIDASDNWEQALPLRAQQRLGFARVVLQRPNWVFMEEATNAFDPKGESLIMEMLHRELPDSAVLTISFHPGLERLHQRKLVLNRLREKRFLFNGSNSAAANGAEPPPAADQ